MGKLILNGQCGCELTPAEAEILRCIFESVLESGSVPTITEIGGRLKRPDEYIIRTIADLEAKDLLLRKKGTQEIVSLYPFSLTPTEHQLFLADGRKLFAMCAIDAVGMPIMFNRDVRIVSRCEGCKREITIEVGNGEIGPISEAEIMIWSPMRKEARPAETCCPVVKFFCSNEHLQQWESQNPDLAGRGRGAGLKQAFPGIKERWKSYGELVGIR